MKPAVMVQRAMSNSAFPSTSAWERFALHGVMNVWPASLNFMPSDTMKMAESNLAWAGKMVLPLLAVGIAFITYWLGNPFLPTLREGDAVLLFLAIVLATEVFTILNMPKADGKRDDYADLGMAGIVVLAILYAGVMFVGVLATEPDSGLVYVFYAMVIAGTACSVVMIDAHRRLKIADPTASRKREEEETKVLTEEAAKLNRGEDGTEL